LSWALDFAGGDDASRPFGATRAGMSSRRTEDPMRRFLLLASACALSSTLPAAAQQPITELPETIVTATRIPTPADRVPAAVTVITRADIEERGYQTLAEALRAVPGMRLVQEGGPGQRASAFLRGANSNHVLVLVDGVPVNDASEPNGAFNFGNDLLGDIERIEVVRGPVSSLYGSGALGGVVNLITRRAPAGTAFQAFGEAAVGTQRTGRGVAGAAGDNGRVDWMVTTQGLSTRGFNTVPPRIAGNTGERDGLDAYAATARLGVRPDANSRVELLLRWRENRIELDDAPDGRVDDPNYTGEDRRWFGQLRGETMLLDGLWTTGLRLAVTDDRRSYRNLPDALSPNRQDDLNRGQRQTADWGNRVRLGDLGALADAGLTFGVTQEREEINSRSRFGSPLFESTGAVREGADATAFHAGLQGRVLERLDLSAGLRHDEAEDFDAFTSWRAGAVLALPELASRLRLSAGTAFKAPTLDQRFGATSGSFMGFPTQFRGNPDLRPETSFSWEIGSETDIALFDRADFATFGVTFFQSRYKDLIIFNDAGDSLANVSRARIHGAELSLTLRPTPWLDAMAGWTITEARDVERDRPLPRRPRNLITAAARIAATERLVIVPELLFTGPSPEYASYSDANTFISGRSYNSSGTVANLVATYRVTQGVSAFVEGRNLTNSRFEPANGYVIPGRWVLVGTRFVF
jgi:vitamin B12 transporter